MICNEFISLGHVLPFCHLSEEDFDLALYEQQSGAIRFDPDHLENLKFNPLISETNNQFSLCSRITSHTATLLDNIFINSLDRFCASGVLFSDVSEHLPVFTFLSEKMNVEDKKTWITY